MFRYTTRLQPVPPHTGDGNVGNVGKGGGNVGGSVGGGSVGITVGSGGITVGSGCVGFSCKHSVAISST